MVCFNLHEISVYKDSRLEPSLQISKSARHHELVLYVSVFIPLNTQQAPSDTGKKKTSTGILDSSIDGGIQVVNGVEPVTQPCQNFGLIKLMVMLLVRVEPTTRRCSSRNFQRLMWLSARCIPSMLSIMING